MRTMESRFVFCALALILATGLSGCRLRGRAITAPGGDDMLDPLNPIDGTYALAPRGEFGAPVADAPAFEPVAFAYDSFKIADSERPAIESVADYLLAHRRITVVVDGHCDERGSREYNLSLGEHRALAIRAYLMSLGVAGDRIHTRSFGSEQPIDPGHDETAWRRNRRGEFKFFRP